MTTQQRFKKGFTLVELLVVVILVGILVTFAVASYLRTSDESAHDNARARLELIGTGYQRFNMNYPRSPLFGQLATPSADNRVCNFTNASNPGPGVNSPLNLFYCDYLEDVNLVGSEYNFFICGRNFEDGSLPTSMNGTCCRDNERPLACMTRTNGTRRTAYYPYRGVIEGAAVL